MSDEREGGYKVKGKTQIGVYLPDELVARLRQRAEENRRGISAEVQLALEEYLASATPETARNLRAALEREGYSTT